MNMRMIVVMAIMVVALVRGLAVQRGLSRFRMRSVFEGVSSAQQFCLPGANFAPTIRLYRLLHEAGSRLQCISPGSQACGSFLQSKIATFRAS
jgi:hypothetical protein